MHSIDQILFGFTLGIWAALLLHFGLRDHVINYFRRQEHPTFHAILLIAVYVIFEITALVTFYEVEGDISETQL